MPAIETVYDGYRFRSRLEARWATFFNYLHIPYQYEKEGFEWSNIGRYLPDFFLSTIGSRGPGSVWVEVKPPEYVVTPYDNQRYESLVVETKHTLLLARGLPPVGLDHADRLCDEYPYVSDNNMCGWDSPMVFIRCYTCQAMRFEFSEGSYMRCDMCSDKRGLRPCRMDDEHPELLAAIEAAKQARF